MPDCEVYYVKNGKYISWYEKTGSRPKYIKKKNHTFLQNAVKNMYNNALLKSSKKQIKLSSQLIGALSENELIESRYLQKDSPFSKYLSTDYQSTDELTAQWLSEAYKSNSDYFPLELKHKTYAGVMVRSKSERTIANTLFRYGIPFRYECELVLNGRPIYPDFTILSPVTGKIIYWEHFGVMDKASYREKARHKLEIYEENGIIPSINLITTYETADTPIDCAYIDTLIHFHFL